MTTISAFAGTFLFGFGCFVLGVLVAVAVKALASLNDGERRR